MKRIFTYVTIAIVIIIAFFVYTGSNDKEYDKIAEQQKFSQGPVEQDQDEISKIIKTALTVIIAILVLVNLLCLPYLIKTMAKNNFFLTLVSEGSAKAVMGSGNSGFQRFIMQYKGHRFNENWDVVDGGYIEKKTGWTKILSFFGLIGVRYLGIPGMQTIHSYTFRWNSLKQAQDDTTQNNGGIYFTPHREVLDYILLQEDIYYARVEGAEDNSMVPLNLDVTLKIKIVNSYKALFKVQEWLEMVWGLIIPSLRRYASQQSWENLVKELTNKSNEFFESLSHDKTTENIENDYGVEIVEFCFVRIAPSGKRAEMYEEAATKEYIANKEAKRIIIKAEAEQKRIGLEYGKILEYKELGELVRKLEALEKVANGSGNTIISAPELSALSSELTKILSKKI